MSQPILRPAQSHSEGQPPLPQGGGGITPSAYPQRKRAIRAGWKATIVRAESFAQLRAIQKSTSDPAIDLSYLMEACLQMALEIGREAIVKRALDGLRPARSSQPPGAPS